MTPEDVTRAALGLPDVILDHPFGPETHVFKVAGKVFAILVPGEEPPRVTLKCEPAYALELRAQFPGVTPGYHTNKRHWNTVTLDGSVPSDEVHDMITHSWDRVVLGLPKAVRERLSSPSDGGTTR
jgi:predicted DNA-binding protein (MmcQ/YjbR family)